MDDGIFGGLETIFQKGLNKWGNYQNFAVDDPLYRNISEIAADFLKDKKMDGKIKDYSVDTFSFDCGPASEPGVCYICWIDNEGNLNTTSYEWYN